MPLLVQGDGFLRLTLRPLHRPREVLQRRSGLLTRIRRLEPLLRLDRDLLAERIRRLPLQMRRVQALQPVPDIRERPLEIASDETQWSAACPQSRERVSSRPRSHPTASHPRRAQRVRRGVTLLPHPIRAGMPAHIVQPISTPVRSGIDALTDILNPILGPILDRIRNQIPQTHQPSPPGPCCCVLGAFLRRRAEEVVPGLLPLLLRDSALRPWPGRSAARPCRPR